MTPTQATYVVALSAAGVTTAAAVVPVRRFPAGETKRGLTWFLGISALWAISEAARLAVGRSPLAEPLYIVGLLTGFATVIAFGYFASAFTGADYHRDPVVRALAAGSYLLVGAMKLTNPIHESYFTFVEQSGAFPAYAVELGPLHWTVTILAYVVSLVAFGHVYQFITDADGDRRRASLLFVLLPLPVVLDVTAALGLVDLLPLFYEPFGVAAFAVGLVWVFDGQFAALAPARRHLIDQIGVPVCIVDDAERILELNEPFRDIAGDGVAVGEPIAAAPPAIAAALRGDRDRLAVSTGGSRRRYRVTVDGVTLGPHRLATVGLFLDVTEERRRITEIDRQNDAMDDIGEALAHELRNAITIAVGHLEHVSERAAIDDEGAAASLETATDGMWRVETLVGRFEQIIADSRTVRSRAPVDLGDALSRIDGPTGLRIDEADDGTLVGDPGRVDHLLENAVAFAHAECADVLAISVESGTLSLSFYGLPTAEYPRDRLLGYGQSVPSAGSGMFLPTVDLIARAHHWNVRLCDEGPSDGDGPPTLSIRIDTDATADPDG